MAIHSCLLAWRFPWREEPGGLELMGSVRVRRDGSEWACRRNSLYPPDGERGRPAGSPPRPRLPPQRRKPSHPRRRARSPRGLARSPGFLFAGIVPLRVMTKKTPFHGLQRIFCCSVTNRQLWPPSNHCAVKTVKERTQWESRMVFYSQPLSSSTSQPLIAYSLPAKARCTWICPALSNKVHAKKNWQSLSQFLRRKDGVHRYSSDWWPLGLCCGWAPRLSKMGRVSLLTLVEVDYLST